MISPTRFCIIGLVALVAEQSYATTACGVEGVSLVSAAEPSTSKRALVVHLAATGLDPVLIQRTDGTQVTVYPMRSAREALAKSGGNAASAKPHFVLMDGEMAKRPASSLGPPLPASQAKQQHTCELTATDLANEGFGLDVWERYCTQNPSPHRMHECLWGSTRNSYLPANARESAP